MDHVEPIEYVAISFDLPMTNVNVQDHEESHIGSVPGCNNH